jgi:hypothetical protein
MQKRKKKYLQRFMIVPNFITSCLKNMPLPSQNILKKELLFLFQIIREKSKTIRFFLRIKIIFMKLNANCFR